MSWKGAVDGQPGFMEGQRGLSASWGGSHNRIDSQLPDCLGVLGESSRSCPATGSGEVSPPLAQDAPGQGYVGRRLASSHSEAPLLSVAPLVWAALGAPPGWMASESNTRSPPRSGTTAASTPRTRSSTAARRVGCARGGRATDHGRLGPSGWVPRVPHRTGLRAAGARPRGARPRGAREQGRVRLGVLRTGGDSPTGGGSARDRSRIVAGSANGQILRGRGSESGEGNMCRQTPPPPALPPTSRSGAANASRPICPGPCWLWRHRPSRRRAATEGHPTRTRCAPLRCSRDQKPHEDALHEGR
jgi:hypothetical protein